MSPRGPGGIRIPDELSYEEPLERAARSHRELSQRMGNLERRVERVETATNGIPQLQSDVSDIKLGVAAFKATLQGLGSKAIMVIVGAIGATFGVTKVTDNVPPPPQPTVVHRSAFDLEVEACGKKEDAAERGACKASVINRHVR